MNAFCCLGSSGAHAVDCEVEDKRKDSRSPASRGAIFFLSSLDPISKVSTGEDRLRSIGLVLRYRYPVFNKFSNNHLHDFLNIF